MTRCFSSAPLLAAVLLLPLPAWAGAWPQNEGSGQIILQDTWYTTTTNGYDPQGRPSGHANYTQLELAPYVEYGLTPRWTIGAQPRLQGVFTNSSGRDVSGYGIVETNLFARYAVWRGENDVFSVQGMVGAAGIDSSDRDPEVANPNNEYELRLLYGHGFTLGEHTGFLEADIAGRARSGTAANELHLDLTAGYRPAPRWLVMAQSFTTKGLRDNETGGSNYDDTKIQLSAVYDLTENWSVQFGGYTEVATRNISRGNAGLVALWYRF